MSDKKFVVLITVFGDHDISVRYHPEPDHLKEVAENIIPGTSGNVWPREIEALMLKDTQCWVTPGMLGHYVEITTATDELKWDVEITSAQLHKGSYKHLNLEPEIEALIWPE